MCNTLILEMVVSVLDSIDIEQNITTPIAEAGPGGELSCALDSIQLMEMAHR
ncbi:MAG: hypothetical protein R2769_17390 [Saprospiraceae bacterium]